LNNALNREELTMDFFEAVKARQSIRAFQSRTVEEEKMNRIVEAVNLAPSAGGLQAYEIIVVKDSRRKEELAKAAGGQGFVSEAPACLVFLTYPERSSRKYGKRGSELYCIQDATIAAAYALEPSMRKLSRRLSERRKAGAPSPFCP